MAAVAGILGQELLGVTPVWFAAGTKDYAIPPLPLTAIEFLVLGFLELKRFQGFKEHKTVRLGPALHPAWMCPFHILRKSCIAICHCNGELGSALAIQQEHTCFFSFICAFSSSHGMGHESWADSQRIRVPGRLSHGNYSEQGCICQDEPCVPDSVLFRIFSLLGLMHGPD